MPLTPRTQAEDQELPCRQRTCLAGKTEHQPDSYVLESKTSRFAVKYHYLSEASTGRKPHQIRDAMKTLLATFLFIGFFLGVPTAAK